MRAKVNLFLRPRVYLLVAVCLAVSAGFWKLQAEEGLNGPRGQDRNIVHVVTWLMDRDHLLKDKFGFNDEISKRSLEAFLASLDPMKVYFNQSDVDEFMQQETKIDDMLRDKDISFAYTVFNRFLQRVDERVALIDRILSEDLEFTSNEELITDRDALRYARNDQESYERWRKRIKYDLLVLKGDDTVGQEARDKLSRRYHSFAKRMHQTDSDELLEMYLTAVTTSFDPHTTYMSASALTNFRILMGLKLEGIGAALQVQDGYTVVTKIIPGGAADKHGKLKPEDRIISVGQGEDGEMVDVIDMKLEDVVKLIRGKADSIVRLGVTPAVGGESKIYKITRGKIELKDSEARAEIIQEDNRKVGYIDLPSFYMDMEGARAGLENFKSTTRDVRKILEDFNDKSVDIVVLDLRRNGGGSLTEAINLTGLFIDHGPVVQVKGSDGAVQHYDDLDRGMVWDGPLVVLTSKFSASASEILAGAIQDYHRGLIIGDHNTHGKGTVQSLLDVGQQIFRIPNPPNYGALKITMQQFYRPNGDSTQKRGVISDIELPSLTTHMDVGEGDLDYSVEFDKVPAAAYRVDRMINSNIINTLKQRSLARINASEDFAKLKRRIARYLEQKQKKRVTLNEEQYFAERKEFDADKEDEKQFEEQTEPQDEIVKRDYYFNEMLAISLDYLSQLEQNRIVRAN